MWLVHLKDHRVKISVTVNWSNRDIVLQFYDLQTTTYCLDGPVPFLTLFQILSKLFGTV